MNLKTSTMILKIIILTDVPCVKTDTASSRQCVSVAYDSSTASKSFQH